jgi:tRNA pseudouridine32 synthase/23S rRNA pseudouridine746 synthase/23S rRNA pseudouridine1911/1915/1917 synthase
MLDLIYQDSDLRVYDKPANVSLLADRSGADNLWDEIKAQGEKPFLVHRLDKGTSGVLLVARNQACQRSLTRAFAARGVHKYYLARVVGQFPHGHTYRIDLPLCKGRKSRYRVAGDRAAIQLRGRRFEVEQTRDGLAACTLVRCIEQTQTHSLLLAKPITGRSHQIRVHLSWLGYAIVGDYLYGKPDDPLQSADRLMLHCHRIAVPGYGSFSAAGAGFGLGSL